MVDKKFRQSVLRENRIDLNLMIYYICVLERIKDLLQYEQFE